MIGLRVNMQTKIEVSDSIMLDVVDSTYAVEQAYIDVNLKRQWEAEPPSKTWKKKATKAGFVPSFSCMQ